MPDQHPSTLPLFDAIRAHIEHSLRGADLVQLGLQSAGALTVGTIIYFGLSAALRFAGRRLSDSQAAAQKPNALLILLGQVIQRTSRLFILVTAITATGFLLPLPYAAWTAIHSVFVGALVIQAAGWGNVVLTRWLSTMGTTASGDLRALANARAIIGTLARALLWSLASLVALDNLGFNVTALVAGLGIGGIAVGLAAQKVVGDLFASLAIVFDKPFEYGDFIVAGAQSGAVERIGLKTTRLRSVAGEQIVISNSDLLDSRIQNFKRMAERRVVFPLRIAYGTSSADIVRIPDFIKAAVTAQERVRFERCHFTGFGEWSLNFETSYVVPTADYGHHLDIQQAIMFEIHRRLAAERIEFAHPAMAFQPARGSPASFSAGK